MERRTLSLNDLFPIYKEKTQPKSLPRFYGNTTWLEVSYAAWVGLSKGEYVDENLQRQVSPKLSRHKDRHNSISRLISRLEKMPTVQRSEEMQTKISALIDLIKPMATKSQLKLLQQIEFPELPRLEAAIMCNDFDVLMKIPRHCWTKELLKKTQFSTLWRLVEEWAPLEEEHTCLRISGSPLYKLWASIIPTAPSTEAPAAVFYRLCVRLWCSLSPSDYMLLHHIQKCLPLQEVDSLPLVMYVTFLFGWFSQHQEPKMLLAYLRKNRDRLCAQWHKEELESIY